MDRRTISEYYTEMANQLIKSEPILSYLDGAPINIIYLESTLRKKGNGKITLGECEKVKEKNKWSIPCDFTITIFAPNVVGMTEDQLKILMMHELMHINKDYTSAKPHDLEDFKYIVERFGVNWADKGDEV